MKVIQWVASSRNNLRAFPDELRVRAALALWQLQLGRQGPWWKRAPLVLPGLRALCLTRRPYWRHIIVMPLENAVVVLHALQSVREAYPPNDLAELRRRVWQLRQSTVMRTDADPFEAMGFTAADAAPLRLRAALLQELTDWLDTSYRPRTEWAVRLGIAPARLSDLRHGKLDRFSLDMLVALLHRAGVDVGLRYPSSTSVCPSACPMRSTRSRPSLSVLASTALTAPIE
ncbi:MAG: XRE family transcriptional regulator [Gemmatimonas sp.]